MSQPSLSTDPDPFAPPELTANQMVAYVEKYCAADAPPTPLRWLVEFSRDPFSRPESYRLKPLWVSFGIFFLLAAGTFFYFTFWSH